MKDENGKRRFHGAFTGGFSAGFWNTVGSLEGWTPQTFKSSRGERASSKAQLKPEDFMDQEDLGEFGIAPQGIRTRDEFANEDEQKQRSDQRRRKLMQPELGVGAIPGLPVLEQLLRPVRDKVAVRILKSMGWKPGQGVGPRQTRKEKRQATARNSKEQYLMEHYGAEGLPSNKENKGEEDSNTEDEDDEDITFAPDDYEPIFYTPKENRFGMSYSGLNRDPILSKSSSSAKPMQHINLFGEMEAQANKKQLSIRGQAFGVGAFEEEDEDIYARDDMTRYDFSLADKKPKQKSSSMSNSVMSSMASVRTTRRQCSRSLMPLIYLGIFSPETGCSDEAALHRWTKKEPRNWRQPQSTNGLVWEDTISIRINVRRS